MNHQVQVFRRERFVPFVALVGLGLLFTASSAKADCGLLSKNGTAPSNPSLSPSGRATSNHQDEDEKSNKHVSIVGLWHVVYTATSAPAPPAFPPTPFQFAESFKQWHADGTEFENAFLKPIGGNICFGVWKDSGHGSVKLHHIGLMFDFGGNVSGTFTQDETNTVASNGKTYSGTFDFKLWPPSFDAVGVGNPLLEVTGTIAATRITVDND